MIFSLVLSALVVLGANAWRLQFVQDIVDTVEDVSVVCASRERPTNGDYRLDLIEDIFEHDFPAIMHLPRCAFACVFEHYKLLKEDGTFNKQTVIDGLKELKAADEDLYRSIMKVLNKCEHETQIFQDRCENSYRMTICVKKAAKAAGLSLEALLED